MCEMATGAALDKVWRSHFPAGHIYSVQVCHMLLRSAPFSVVLQGQLRSTGRQALHCCEQMSIRMLSGHPAVCS